MQLIPFAATCAVPAVLGFMQVMGVMYTDYTAAPPQTTYAWAWSYVMPETTDVNQFYVLVGNAFSPLQIQQFCADVVEYWNSCWVNEVYWRRAVQEMSMYDKLQSFPYFWRICRFGFRRVVEFVFLKFCGQSGLKLRAIEFFLQKKECFQQLFKAILHLLWTY